METPLTAWIVLIAFLVVVLVLDLVVIHRKATVISIKEAALWSTVWVLLGLAFCGLLAIWRGPGPAEEYLAGYLIEKSLSVDNIFVFALIFGYFGIPDKYQHRVLMWGIVGALAMRAVFIIVGAALLDAFHATIYVFGALLLLTAVKILRHGATQVHPDRNLVLRALRRVAPVTDRLHGQRLLVRVNGVWTVTPLLAALLVIETTDVVFAVDSIPAIFAVTQDTFIVFAANAFSLLGMRAAYFLISGAARRFRHLQTGLGVILAGVGVKLLLTDFYKVPVWASLTFIIGVLAVTFAISWYDTRGPDRTRPDV
ncbi:TerC family protein [Streptomyces sp. J2-1]|uniref:TerC family protein n=1 Tax=Streptomyces corallincola TaxID=2851888 RepID=UPI001C38F605|nr:TerC family protein [Streptomyces corallincola]MBV2354411.1 TerC family protein [Streptomyces corallincola]